MAEEKSRPNAAEDSGGMTAVTAPAKKPAKPAHKPKQLPPFKVLLHNDEVNTFEHVIRCVVMVAHLEPQEAVLRTLEAHETGVALLLVTHQERAELLVEQFASLSLHVTIEPA